MASGGKASRNQSWTPSSKAPKYVASALKDIGKDEKKYRKYLNDEIERWVGKDFDVALQPWCAIWLCGELEENGYPSPKAANARSFLKWGVSVKDQEWQEGDIVVFWRGHRNDGVTGHVGIILTYDEDTIVVLGGNQGDKICIQNFSHNKLLDVRRYQSLWKTTTTRVAGSKVAVGAEEIARHSMPDANAQAAEGTKTLLEQIVTYMPNMGQTIGIVILCLGLFLIYKQYKDSRNA